MRHGLASWRGSRFERDHDRINLRLQPLFGYADCLHRSHTGTNEIVRKVSGTGEVIGDTTEQNLAHSRCSMLPSPRPWRQIAHHVCAVRGAGHCAPASRLSVAAATSLTT